MAILSKKVFILKIFPNLCKTFCLYSCHAYFILLLKSGKLYRKKWNSESLKPIYWLKKPVPDSCWLDHWKWIMPGLMHVVPEFLSNEEGLNRFSWHVLPKLSKITDLSKVSKKDQIGWILTFPKLVKYISTLNCSKSAKCLVWKFIYLQLGRC